jgi:hypothetical protein
MTGNEGEKAMRVEEAADALGAKGGRGLEQMRYI